MTAHDSQDSDPAVLGLLVKSFSEDFDLACRLVTSLNTFNIENLPTWIVVPETDVEQFKALESDVITVLPETLLARHLVTGPVAGIRPGYINQEIVKISFWELGLAENYFPIDSDAIILRDFGHADLMWDEHTPYTVLVEDNDLKVDPEYFTQNWQGREESLRRIQREVGLKDRRILTCHGHQILSSRVLKSLKLNFMIPRDLSYADLLEIAPYEFSWYNFWLQKDETIPIHIREPLMKVAHSTTQHMELALRGITAADLGRGYVGAVINSNFAKSWGGAELHEDRSQTLARYLTWSQLLKVLTRKVLNSFNHWFRRRA